MNKFLKNFALVAPFSIALLAGCGATVPNVGDDTIPHLIVADAIAGAHLNLYVAYELGLFEQHGITVEILTLDTNAGARDLVATGHADIFLSCPTVAIAAIANGAPISTIAQVKSPCTSALSVPPDSEIRTLADLQGLLISGVSPACEAIITFTKAMSQESLLDFELTTMSSGAALVALQAGQLDGAILEEPHTTIAELNGFIRMFDYLTEGIPCRTVNARNLMINSNPDAILAFVAALDEANAIIMADPTAANVVEIGAYYTGAPVEAVALANQRFGFDVALQTEGLIMLADVLVELGDIRENPYENMFANALKGVTW